LLTVAEKIPIRGIRKIIFKNMKLRQSTQAQLTLQTEASARDLKALRTVFNARLTDDQPRVSYNAILIKAAARALQLFPMLNASVDGHEIKIWDQIHIGVAMDFGQGLIVPKIRNTDTKSILTLSNELSDLTRRAEKKQLLPDELNGGTFTITNLGAWDIDYFSPIVNFPESAILGVGRIIEKPWVKNGSLVADLRLPLSLTFDHRIIDGALAAQFLKTLKDRLEDTRLML
jgi:pyruvate/2-oxoglutarate dehydrogenase complex dihydrolipoamide acyltransferase (E2) component